MPQYLTSCADVPDPHTAVTAGRGEELLLGVQAQAEDGTTVALEQLVRVGGRVRHLHRHVRAPGRQQLTTFVRVQAGYVSREPLGIRSLV